MAYTSQREEISGDCTSSAGFELKALSQVSQPYAHKMPGTAVVCDYMVLRMCSKRKAFQVRFLVLYSAFRPSIVRPR